MPHAKAHKALHIPQDCVVAVRAITRHYQELEAHDREKRPSEKEVQPVLEYHHVGIPTDTVHEGEQYLEAFKMYVTSFDSNPYGVEWLRFEPDSSLPELVKTVAHVAFKVDDLAAELEGKEILIEPNSPSEGVTVAFIVHNGAPIEFLEYG